MTTLLELLQAHADGKTVERRMPSLPVLARVGSHRGTVRYECLYSEGLIADAWRTAPNAVRVKPQLKPVDLSVLIDSGIDCEFWGHDCEIGSEKSPFIGKLTGVANHFICNDRRRFTHCRPRLDHWHAWVASGAPKLPTGLALTVQMRGGAIRTGQKSDVTTTWARAPTGYAIEHRKNEMIALKVTGPADGYCWPGPVVRLPARSPTRRNQNGTNMTDKLLTPAEVAEQLRLSKRTVLELIEDGKLPAARLGWRTIRIKQADVDALLEQRGSNNATS